jgi:hypothetical protein
VVVIANGPGTTRIGHFAAGDSSGDVIDVSAFFSSFDELTDHIISQNDTDVVIALDGNDTLVLADLIGALNALDFWFG